MLEELDVGADPDEKAQATVFARPGPYDGAPVDMAHLARYTLGDPILEREVLNLFLAQIPLLVEALRFSAGEADWRRAAHTLKGSARAIGAWDLGAAALEAETEGWQKDPEAIARSLAPVETAAAEVEDFIRARVCVDAKGATSS